MNLPRRFKTVPNHRKQSFLSRLLVRLRLKKNNYSSMILEEVSPTNEDYVRATYEQVFIQGGETYDLRKK